MDAPRRPRPARRRGSTLRSPRRLDPAVVRQRLRLLDELLDVLAATPTDVDLVHDRVQRYAVERILTQLVETASAINEHVVGARLAQVATSYRDSFVRAAEVGLIDEALRDELLPSVGMRSVLVHDYLEVDLARIAAAVPLDVYRRYVTTVATFVADLDP